MTQRHCKHCNQPFTPKSTYSQAQKTKQQYCSQHCAQMGNLTLARGKKVRIKGVACERCGRVAYDRVRPICRYCQKDLAQLPVSDSALPVSHWTPELEEYVRQHYPTQGAAAVAGVIGFSPNAVRVKANKLGVRLTKGATRKLVNGRAAEHMRQNNPMHNAESLAKAKQWRIEHPNEMAAIFEKLMLGKQRMQRNKISNLEKRLHVILDALGVQYEHTVLIKPSFLVDVRIGMLIIQADGEYWHGHPRFEPLTERQQAQQRRDAAQDVYLRTCGYAVVRIWERDMTESCVVSILKEHSIPMRRDA